MRFTRRAATALAVTTAVMGSVVGMAGSASANPGESFLYRGQSLNAGQYIQRASYNGGTIRLVMQNDGNLVEYLYLQGGTIVCWASDTYGSGSNNHATYQQDGNFVVYTSGGYPVWSSHTAGKGGSTVDMTSSGDLFVGYTKITPEDLGYACGA